MHVTANQVRTALAEILDPELNIPITELGLVYDIQVKDKNRVKITMTLTSLGCPLFAQIERDIKNKLPQLGITEEDIEIELTFDPPWSMDKMSESAKAMLGI